MSDTSKDEMKLREWCYCQVPPVYEISCDECGGSNITWSEYERHIWCFDCKIDTKGTGGVFDGPIAMRLSTLLGMSFDRIRLSDGKLLKMKIIDGKIEYE